MAGEAMEHAKVWAARAFWTIVHDVLAHPFCGVAWVIGLKRFGDWLHEVTLPPLSWEDRMYNPGHTGRQS